ncbi:MAG: HlyD family secretion protein [Geminicoccaceae bacterium]
MADAAEQATVTALRKAEPVPVQHNLPPARRSRRQHVRWVLLVAGPTLLLAVVGWIWFTGGRYVSTDNAYVHTDMMNVATDVDGLVRSIEVGDNQKVRKGQVLFTLDDSVYRSAFATAEANLALAATELRALQANYAQSQAQIVKAEADVAFYTKEQRRQRDLVSRRATAQAQLDAADHNLDTATAQLAALRQEEAGIAAQLGGNPQAPVEQHPRYLAAVAARDRAAHDLEHTVVRASMDGVTANVPALQPGEYLEAGKAAFALVATGHVWVEANPKETDLTYVQPGQPVTVTVDTYPGHVWEGRVDSLSPASQAQFSLLPAQNTSGNWVKVVQRIPLRVRVEPRPGEPALRAGMSAEIDVDTGHLRHWRDLLGGWLG